jgi:hypothetical protein
MKQKRTKNNFKQNYKTTEIPTAVLKKIISSPKIYRW